jgi:hypothetical protein
LRIVHQRGQPFQPQAGFLARIITKLVGLDDLRGLAQLAPRAQHAHRVLDADIGDGRKPKLFRELDCIGGEPRIAHLTGTLAGD